MHRFILILSFFFLLSAGAYSQVSMCRCQMIQKQYSAFEKPLVGKAFYNYFPLDKTQFYGDWAEADIYLSDNTVIKNKLVRYNALMDEFIWKREGDSQLIVINRKNIARVIFSDINMVFEKIEKNHIQHPENGNMYAQLLTMPEGKVSLYKKIVVIENSNLHQLESSETLYLYIHNDFKVVRPNKAALYRLFGDEKPLIKQLIYEHHISLKTDADLAQVINLYNASKVRE